MRESLTEQWHYMVVEQFVHVDGPKKVPMVEQFVVYLKQALYVTELTGRPFTVLQNPYGR